MLSISYDEVERFLRRLEARAPGNHFRLPTEAEWEYACRAGSTTAFHTGTQLAESQANFDGRFAYAGASPQGFRGQPLPVGRTPPNAWGLQEMHGNVWEWTADWYGPYPKEAVSDPHGPAQGTQKVLRGGSWAFPAGCARSATRYPHAPGDLGYSIGFRVVWEP
jgi:formylglycine-generating enzyme required for sulfatase activity